MSLFTRHATITTTADQLLASQRAGRTTTVAVTAETAMRVSAVWACLRLRADLVSTMPVDAYRQLGDLQIEVPKPPVLVAPGGERVGIKEWLYSSQVDLDRSGNAFGLVTARDGRGLPARIELVPLSAVSVRQTREGAIEYRVEGRLVESVALGARPMNVWHERQFTIAGLPVGLSPVAFAAWSIGEYLSVQEFALDWFGGGAIPSADLKNTAKTINADEAALVKARYKATVAAGDVFVHGADWELKPITAASNQTEWIEAKSFGILDIARFFGCPGDLIDAAVGGSSVTYATITQRNLQFLIMNLGPAVARREDALSLLLPRPQFVKLNAGALLRMDPQTRAGVMRTQIESRQLAPSEARELENRPPFTPAQLAEFAELFGSPRTTPTGATA